MTNDVENHNKIRNLVEELRIQKEKVKKLEKECKKDKETRRDQIERIKKIEDENAKHKNELDFLISKKRGTATEEVKVEVNIEQIKKEKD